MIPIREALPYTSAEAMPGNAHSLKCSAGAMQSHREGGRESGGGHGGASTAPQTQLSRWRLLAHVHSCSSSATSRCVIRPVTHDDFGTIEYVMLLVCTSSALFYLFIIAFNVDGWS
jgi:hypothetical protein